MSAPTPGGPREVPALPPKGEDSLEALARRTERLCAAAVDTLEVAAGLEADGINDEIAAHYGYPDVFALADDLYERTGRRPPTVAAPPNPWRAEAWRHLLRGVLFGLPGLCYAVATPSTGAGGGAVLVLSLLLSWPVSQGVAYLAYVRIGRKDRPAAARLMRRGLLPAGLLLVPVIVLAGVVLHAGPAATALAAAQCVYLLAATVALVDGCELWLLTALTPGAAVSAILLATGGAAWPYGWGAWAITITATVTLAVVRTAGPWQGAALSWADVVAALPYGLFGLFAGGLLTFATVAALLGGSTPPPATALAMTCAVLALSLSMGVAEWILVCYRRIVYRLLLGSRGLRSFAWVARAALAAAVAGYVAALTALTAVIVALAAAATSWVIGGYICLGGAFFVALLLQSCGRIRAVLVGCGLALGGQGAGAFVADPGAAQFGAGAALFGGLLIFAFVVLGRATSHR